MTFLRQRPTNVMTVRPQELEKADFRIARAVSVTRRRIEFVLHKESVEPIEISRCRVAESSVAAPSRLLQLRISSLVSGPKAQG